MGTQALVRGSHSVHSLHFHLVLVTKYRRRALNAELLDRLEEIGNETLQL